MDDGLRTAYDMPLMVLLEHLRDPGADRFTGLSFNPGVLNGHAREEQTRTILVIEFQYTNMQTCIAEIGPNRPRFPAELCVRAKPFATS